MKRGFWRFGRREVSDEVVAMPDSDPVEVEIVSAVDEFVGWHASEESEELPVKRGFWRFGRAKSDDAVAESDVTAWDAAEEFEVAAAADEPVLDEPEVVESEVEVVAEADEFAVDVEESAAVKRGFWRFGRAKSDEDVVAESDVAAWDARRSSRLLPRPTSRCSTSSWSEEV